MDRFVIVSASGMLRADGGWARHPIAAWWFSDYALADAVIRRQWSRTPCAVRTLDESCTRFLGDA